MSFPRGAFVALLCVLYACAVSAASQVTSITATVACAAGSSPHAALSCRLSSGHSNAGATAWGTFNDTIAQNGWSQLEVWTQRADAASLRETAASCGVDAARILAFGVGCVEGALTQARIFQMVTNAKANLFPGGVLPTVAKLYLGVQVAAVRGGVAAHYKPIEMPGGHATHARGSPSSSSSVETRYWQGMGVVMAHFDGLAAAYNATAPAGSNITDLELYAASSADDLGTLVNLATARSVADSKRILSKLVGAEVTAAHVEELSRVPLSTPSVDFLGCSAYVKVLPSSSGKTEDGAASPSMLVSHATWSNMWEMLRTYKMFHLAYAPAGTVSFSSYPGFLASGDDFYTAQDTQLAVVETTNNIYNNSLYEHLDPFAAFSWQRAIAATWFGTGPADWAALFGFQNSGTYNCNWMATRLDGTVPSPSSTDYYVELEQVPGLVVSKDLSGQLATEGYIASYNIPRFVEIYNISGYNKMYAQHGNAYSFTECPRGQIFRRNASDVTDVDSGCALIRYNNYEHDPLSMDNPMNAVSSRGDLLPNATAFGAYDAKLVTDVGINGASVRVHAVSGPTHAQLPPFSWSERDDVFASVSHVGQPDVFDFPWMVMTTTPPSQ